MLATHTSAMEPLLPSDPDGGLRARATTLLRESAALDASVHPRVRDALSARLAEMNSYYSNLIEGHATHPLDIERALAGRYDRDPAKRALQQEARAHVEVQRLVDRRLLDTPDLFPASPTLLAWLHEAFYARLPESIRTVSGEGLSDVVVPAAFRVRPVIVGRHVPPEPAALTEFLARIESAYAPTFRDPLLAVVAGAAAHHRLMWIHPFLDGNGRVLRLVTDAWFVRAGVASHGLWRLSRGLARRRSDYFAALAGADAPRQGDLDGRGALSDRMLREFAAFVLDVAIDQVRFMTGALALDSLVARLQAWVERRASMRELNPAALHLVRDVLLRGSLPRGEAGRVTGLPDRTARTIVSQLVAEGVFVSDTPKGALVLGFPAAVMADWFPRLYPAEVEERLRSARA